MITQFLKLFGAAFLLTLLIVFLIGFSTGTITIKYTDAITDSKAQTETTRPRDQQ